jgi:D-psicose/D-tagatose/L-ribulose 3-epimerase
MFFDLGTYHRNTDEKGAANGILDARKYLKYIRLSESDRGTPGSAAATGRSLRRARRNRLQGRGSPWKASSYAPEVAYGLSARWPVLHGYRPTKRRRPTM